MAYIVVSSAIFGERRGEPHLSYGPPGWDRTLEKRVLPLVELFGGMALAVVMLQGAGFQKIRAQIESDGA